MTLHGLPLLCLSDKCQQMSDIYCTMFIRLIYLSCHKVGWVTSSLVLLVCSFFPRCMECQHGLAMKKVSVRQSACQMRGL